MDGTPRMPEAPRTGAKQSTANRQKRKSTWTRILRRGRYKPILIKFRGCAGAW